MIKILKNIVYVTCKNETVISFYCLASEPVFEKIMDNSQTKAILNYIPTKYVMKNKNDILKYIQQDYHKKLPDILVSIFSLALFLI